jgi:hypothetical protein
MTGIKTAPRATASAEPDGSITDLKFPTINRAMIPGVSTAAGIDPPAHEIAFSPMLSELRVEEQRYRTQSPLEPRPFLASMGIIPSPPPASGSFRTTAEHQQILALIETTGRDEIALLDTRWNRAPSVAWNEIARELVAQNAMNPPEASRLYALLSIAQHDALVLAARAKEDFFREAPAQVVAAIPLRSAPEAISAYPSHHGSIAAASKMILAAAFPDATEKLEGLFYEHLKTRILSGVSAPSDLSEGAHLGYHSAREISRYAAERPVPRGVVSSDKLAGGWYADEHGALLPGWGTLEPLVMEHPAQFRPAPPPERGSAIFRAALTEVQELCRNRSPEQLELVRFWADGPGTATPPGHWNAIASELITRYEFEDSEAARVLAYLNVALYDAGISCWETKYYYGLARPSQVDPTISTPVGVPPFPAYTSGHATFSGAAAEVLGFFFPRDREELTTLAEAAALSRVLGGIHYRFDGERGLAVGRQIGALAVRRAQLDPLP